MALASVHPLIVRINQTNFLYFLNGDVLRAVIDQERKENIIASYAKDSSLPFVDLRSRTSSAVTCGSRPTRPHRVREDLGQTVIHFFMSLSESESFSHPTMRNSLPFGNLLAHSTVKSCSRHHSNGSVAMPLAPTCGRNNSVLVAVLVRAEGGACPFPIFAFADNGFNAFRPNAADLSFKAELKSTHSFNALNQHGPFQFRAEIPVALAATQVSVKSGLNTPKF
jgi:hypothetical protein